MNQITLTKEQAVALAFAFMADHYAREELHSGSMEGYDAWSRMRDSKLVALFGMTERQIHDFGHGRLEDAA